MLRDSHHIGVQYGKYDLERLLVTLTVANDEKGEPVLAVEEGGWHAAEGLILARYMMFTQVYFQHARRAYDFHVAEAMKHLLTVTRPCSHPYRGSFPPPNSKDNIRDYLDWDDWLVTGLIHSGYADDHGDILKERRHHRCVYQTKEVPTVDELNKLEDVRNKLGSIISFVDRAEKSWYKFEKEDINIMPSHSKHVIKNANTILLSSMSSVVSGLKAVMQKRVYVPLEYKEKAIQILEG